MPPQRKKAAVTDLDIRYRDGSLVAIDKPPGLLVHRTALAPDRKCALQQLRDQIGQRVYPAHRLDRPTSGVLVFTLDKTGLKHLFAQFARHTVEKTYLAVVRGYVERAGCIDYGLRTDRDRPRRPAVTRYRRLARAEIPVPVGRYDTARYSLVAVRPLTGRMHQIRKHFAHISHPLIGDTAHGEGRHNRLFRERFGIHRLMLAAVHIALDHPVNETRIDIGAPPPPEFRALAQTLFHRPLALETQPLAAAMADPPVRQEPES
jgi:tRNA pseudouridine65 synthase